MAKNQNFTQERTLKLKTLYLFISIQMAPIKNSTEYVKKCVSHKIAENNKELFRLDRYCDHDLPEVSEKIHIIESQNDALKFVISILI